MDNTKAIIRMCLDDLQTAIKDHDNWRKRIMTTGGRGSQQLEEEDLDNWRKRI